MVIAVALAFAFSGGDDEGESSAPSRVPSVSSSTEARDLAKRVTLAPGDWGSTFVRDSPYENTDLSWSAIDQNCKIVADSLKGALDNLGRSVKESNGTAYAASSLITYKGADLAQRGISRQREPLQRCPTQSQAGGEERYDHVHEVAVPALKGFDDVVAEEGHLGVNSDGQKTDEYYALLTGRKGQFVLQSSMNRRGAGSQEQNRDAAIKALTLMLSRLGSS
ncbi:hypothetical protein ACWD6P_01455 [Streptomyces sp. NPDC002446]